MFPWLCNVSKKAADYIHASGPNDSIDMYDVAKRITVDVIGQLLYAEDLQATAFRWEHMHGVQQCTFDC